MSLRSPGTGIGLPLSSGGVSRIVSGGFSGASPAKSSYMADGSGSVLVGAHGVPEKWEEDQFAAADPGKVASDTEKKSGEIASVAPAVVETGKRFSREGRGKESRIRK
jgi:hypothetical protein